MEAFRYYSVDEADVYRRVLTVYWVSTSICPVLKVATTSMWNGACSVVQGYGESLTMEC